MRILKGWPFEPFGNITPDGEGGDGGPTPG
jgi:hypothetical protein